MSLEKNTCLVLLNSFIVVADIFWIIDFSTLTIKSFIVCTFGMYFLEKNLLQSNFPQIPLDWTNSTLYLMRQRLDIIGRKEMRFGTNLSNRYSISQTCFIVQPTRYFVIISKNVKMVWSIKLHCHFEWNQYPNTSSLDIWLQCTG